MRTPFRNRQHPMSTHPAVLPPPPRARPARTGIDPPTPPNRSCPMMASGSQEAMSIHLSISFQIADSCPLVPRFTWLPPASAITSAAVACGVTPSPSPHPHQTHFPIFPIPSVGQSSSRRWVGGLVGGRAGGWAQLKWNIDGKVVEIMQPQEPPGCFETTKHEGVFYDGREVIKVLQ